MRSQRGSFERNVTGACHVVTWCARGTLEGRPPAGQTNIEISDVMDRNP